MKPIPLVSGWNLLPFARFLRDIGAPVERWLAESRIPPGVLEAPDQPVPFEWALDFAERAAREEGADTLGIDVGRRTAAESLGSFGTALARCVTFYDRMETCRRLLSRVNNRETMWMEVDGSTARVHADLAGVKHPGLRHSDDFTLMLILEALGRAAGAGWKPDAIRLPGMRSQRFARDELFQGVRIDYGAPDLAVVFSRELLSRPLPGLAGQRATRCRSGVSGETRPLASDFVGSLESTIEAQLFAGCPTIHDLADVAHTTPRTLQRRLAECGTSLRQVVDRARFRLADEYLRDPSASVTGIALELGYSDSTAFSRAFRRMAGVAPSTYRAQRLDA